MAFTLVELLVVIAIIIVLASLLLAAVFKALDLANEAATRTDVTQISAAVQSFQTKYQVNYIPSRIILCENPADYFNPGTGQAWTPLHQDSLDYLQRVFPSIGRPTLAASPWAATGIDWNGDNAILDPPMAINVYNPATGSGSVVTCNGWLLEGEQCLVFFLGGIYANGAMNGFSTNPSNPVAGTDRVPPFFDFKSDRLQVIPGTVPTGFFCFPSYMDGYRKTPYAYFSSYKTANGYNRYINYSNPYLPVVASSAPVTSDCQALSQYGANGIPVFPYCQSGMGLTTSPPGPAVGPPVYLNGQTFQIISAGKNLTFGNGTVVQGYPGAPAGNQIWVSNQLWTPNNATLFYPVGSPGYDDIANFYDRLLGVPTQ